MRHAPSCEIKNFAEKRLCKLRVMCDTVLGSRVLRGVRPREGKIIGRFFESSFFVIACFCVSSVSLVERFEFRLMS